MNVLGLDPGSLTCGYAVVSDGRRDGGVIEMGILKLTKKARLFERLGELVKDIDEIIRERSIDGVCLENVFVHHAHPQSSLVLAQARGAILGYIAARWMSGEWRVASHCEKCGSTRPSPLSPRPYLEVIEPAPCAVKKWLTGSGNANKEQMQLAVQRECGFRRPPEPHDVADAIALAMYGRRQILLNRAVTA